MTNPRMLERNRFWKRRVSALGIATFIGLSALIGKQAEQSQMAAAASETASTPAPSTVASVPNTPAATTSPSTASTTTTSSAASTTAVHTRTTSSR